MEARFATKQHRINLNSLLKQDLPAQANSPAVVARSARMPAGHSAMFRNLRPENPCQRLLAPRLFQSLPPKKRQLSLAPGALRPAFTGRALFFGRGAAAGESRRIVGGRARAPPSCPTRRVNLRNPEDESPVGNRGRLGPVQPPEYPIPARSLTLALRWGWRTCLSNHPFSLSTPARFQPWLNNASRTASLGIDSQISRPVFFFAKTLAEGDPSGSVRDFSL
jgi:hypothetical protein